MHVKHTLLLTGMLVSVISTNWETRLWADDWRGFRGANTDSTSDGGGIFAKGGAFSLTVAWTQKIGSGYSSVSVVDGVAINLFSDPTSDFAGAFDANSGRELWRFRLGDRYPGRWGSKDASSRKGVGERGFGQLAKSMKEQGLDDGERAESIRSTCQHSGVSVHGLHFPG